MGRQDVTPSDRVEGARWISHRLLPFGEAKMGSVIPTGFECYVRLQGREFPHSAIDAATASILATHTSTPGHCWMCLWEGYGYLTGAVAVLQFSPIGQAPPAPIRIPKPRLRKSRVRLPHRNYLLFTGSVAQSAGWDDGPNLCWPDDRSWVVAREIDLDYTLVGGPAKLCAELVARGAAYVNVEDRN